MLTPETADALAAEWVAAWNAHDLDRILTHYAAGIEFTSPFVARLLGKGETTIRGLLALRSYFGRALAAYPDLVFRRIRVYMGADSLVVEYESVNGLLAAEVMVLDEAGKVVRVYAHYRSPDA